MKILHWAIILVIIVVPIAIVCMINVNSKFSALKDEVRINNAIDTATQDAIDQLISLNSATDYSGKFEDIIDVTPGLAQEMIDTFFHTLAVNFNIPYQVSSNNSDTNYGYIKNYFSSYVPAIIVVAYDGFYVYSLENNGGGYKYELSSKIPYAKDFIDPNGKRYTIGYTLGNDIYLYYNGNCYCGKLTDNSLAETKTKYDETYATAYNESGISDSIEYFDYIYNSYNDMSCILYALSDSEKIKFDPSIMPSISETSFLEVAEYDENNIPIRGGAFELGRQETIVKIITDTLNEEINVDHQKYANIMGVTYDFSIPTLSKQDWMNTIEDISFFAFVQGIPIGNAEGIFYNNFALGGSKIVRGNGYVITKEKDGFTYYHEFDCKSLEGVEISDDRIQMIGIRSKYEAVNDYNAYPCPVCN